MPRLLLAVLLLLLTACASSEPMPGGTRAQQNRAAVQAVVEELRRGEELVQVTGAYGTVAPRRGQVDITITVPDGTSVEEQEAILDRAEQLVWRSPVDPLAAIALVLLEADAAAPQASARQRSYVGRRQVAQLEQKYGER